MKSINHLVTLQPFNLATLLPLYLFTLLPCNLFSQSRGTSPGEVYYQSTWYYTDAAQYDMVIRTQDYGLTFQPVYVYKHNSGNTPVGKVLCDATPGVIYMQSDNELHISQDSAKSWTTLETPGSDGRYATGCTEGEIYKCCASYEGYIWKSNDFGNHFEIIRDSAKYVLECGVADSVMYGLDMNIITSNHNLFASFDGSYTFNNQELDPEIGGGQISGNHLIMSSGAQSGELYIVTWHPPANYKIFRSTDYGENFTLQYEQPDTCNFYYESYGFTAGRSSGEFYIFKKEPWFDGTNTRLTLYYSSDYAKTFKKRTHILDQNWTSINEQFTISNEQLKNYPNPFTNTTTISVGNHQLKYGFIEIMNINGHVLESIPITGAEVEWNAVRYKSGIYFYRIKSEKGISKTLKMIKQ